MKKLLLAFFILIYNATLGQSFFSTVSGVCGSDAQVELGTKFTTTANGTITALRFYKCTTANETYPLKLYSGSTLVASGSYSGTAQGWISVNITPVQIVPGVTYTVAYWSPNGRYQYSNPYSSWPVKTGTLTATGSVYTYRTTNVNSVPTSTNVTSNYFADIVLKAACDTIIKRDTIVQIKHDTTVIYTNVYIHDTVKVPVYIHDTTVVTVHDTMWAVPPPPVYIRDTVTLVKVDTLYMPRVCPVDSQHYLERTDTLWLDLYNPDNKDSLPDYLKYWEMKYSLPGTKPMRFIKQRITIWKREEEQEDGSWIER